MGRKKLFGIGAVVLLTTVAISPVLADTDIKELKDLKIKLEQFFKENEMKLNEIYFYIKNLEEVPDIDEISGNITDIIGSLSEELSELIDDYNISQPWTGITSGWRSDTKEQFFGSSELYFWAWVVSLNKDLTDLLIIFAGFGIIGVIIFLLSKIPVIGPFLVVLFGIILFHCWDYFIEFLENIADKCPCGCRLWFFWPPEKPLRGVFKGDCQPCIPWTPEDDYPQTNWTRLF